MDLVVDASVVYKWFVGEKGSERAKTLLEDFVAEDIELHAPAHLPFEVLNGLRLSALATEEQVLQVQLGLEGLALRYHPLEGEVARRAIRIAFSFGLTLYDAAYLALARHLGVKVVTADGTLLSAGGRDALLLDDYSPAGDATPREGHEPF